MRVICLCQRCSAPIEFDESETGNSVQCPACSLETRLDTNQTAPPRKVAAAPKTKCCPECGRELYSDISKCPECGASINKKRNALLIVGICAVIGLVFAIAAISLPKPPPKPHVNAGVKVLDDGLIIFNRDATNWPALDVYINGLPLFTYGCGIPPVKAGDFTTVRLVDFTKDSGERFRPDLYRVTKVYIGGHGYDYAGWQQR